MMVHEDNHAWSADDDEDGEIIQEDRSIVLVGGMSKSNKLLSNVLYRTPLCDTSRVN